MRIEWTALKTFSTTQMSRSTHNVTRPAHELRFLRIQQRPRPLRIAHHPLRPRRCVCLTGFRSKDRICHRHHPRRSQTRSEGFGYLFPTQLTRSAPCQTLHSLCISMDSRHAPGMPQDAGHVDPRSRVYRQHCEQYRCRRTLAKSPCGCEGEEHAHPSLDLVSASRGRS